ncbi:peptide chain release factor 1 [Xenorhabdus mauleonii]|uniref:Peptide chain release factor 1 n=1 Tax=Xenorhabdus mauleonii TaxID=351675 RepID=A0A1I3IH66_9GAMM|nr:peptide chain release factor 1 [Xenorhabdus mauleonii]SFI47167.1 hypothetical protein SAMN05421680_101341 [Xenorhabdus mauleonii]
MEAEFNKLIAADLLAIPEQDENVANHLNSYSL